MGMSSIKRQVTTCYNPLYYVDYLDCQ